jgi:tyrosine-protein phosphatase SIW14
MTPPPNFKQVNPYVYRGGHPETDNFSCLSDLGIGLIVSLEIDDLIEATPLQIAQEERDAKSANIELLRFPISAFEPGISERFDELINGAIRAIVLSTRPVYVHCRHGQDRTGLVIGLWRVERQLWMPQEAHDEMIADGFHVEFLGLEDYFERRTGFSA